MCKDLKTGKTSTQSINHLRTLDLNDLLSLQIDPTYAFTKDLVDMSRMKNLHGKLTPESEYVETQDDARTTRSGLTYTSSKTRPSNSILKSIHSLEDIDNFYCNGPSQRAAILRGLIMAKQSGVELSNQQKKLFNGNSTPFSQSRFTVKNVLRKGSKRPKLQWNDKVEFKKGNTISYIQLQNEKNDFIKCNYSKIILQPFGNLSLKETSLLI